MADIEHKNITTPNLHDPGYNQATDPGAVGAGQYWVDTSGGTGNWVLKVRNAADTGWETVASGGGGTSGSTIYHVDVPPSSPSNYDDEFDDDSFDTTLWDEFDHPSLLTVSEADGHAKLALAANSGLDYAGIHQEIQSGNFTYTCKIKASLPKRNMYSHIGLFLMENDTATGNLFGIVLNTTRTDYNQRVTILEMSDYQTFSTEDTYEARVYNDTFIYLRIRYDGTDYIFEWSMDGIGWRWLWDEDDALYSGNATDIGILLNCEDASEGITGYVEWFRYENSDVGNAGYTGGGDLGAGGASADFDEWSPTAPNPSASTHDDEFDGSEGSGAPTGWTEYDPGSILTVSEEDYGLSLVSTNANQICGVYIDAPTWGYSIETRVSILCSRSSNNVKAGIFVSEDIASNPTTCDHTIFCFLAGNAGFGYQIEEYSSYTTYKGGEVNNIQGWPGPVHQWIRVRTNSSNQWLTDYSEDGIGWIHRHTHTRDFNPGEIGLFVKTDQSNTRVIFSHFRMVLTDNQGVSVVHAGDRVDRFLT